MTFYEQELRKIVGERYPDATYVGRACYVRLSDMNRAKIQFVTGIVSNQYNALQMTILNRSEGQVDTLRLRFSDLLGTSYFDFKRSGQLEWTAPAILFACLVFTLTAPLYIWQIIGI